VLLEPRQPFGNQANNLIRFHHTDVQIGHQGKSATPLASATVQHQSACLGDGYRTPTYHTIAVVELLIGERWAIAENLDPRWEPTGRYVDRSHQSPDLVFTAYLSDNHRQIRRK
jgi:hypothetical protein